MNVYVASSWRNKIQPDVVAILRQDGHEVYDFKNPAPGENGFGWRQLGGKPREEWDAEHFSRVVLDHPVAAHGFGLDMEALKKCAACVLVLPCGRSAHLELGYAVGARKLTVVYMPELEEPELMYRMCDYVETSIDGVRRALSRERPRPRWQADLEAFDARCVHGGKEYEGLLPCALMKTRFRTSDEEVRAVAAFGGPLPERGPCREYHHRECATCQGCWRHGACTCSPSITIP